MEDNLIEVSVRMVYSDMTYAVDLVLKGLTINYLPMCGRDSGVCMWEGVSCGCLLVGRIQL